MTPTGFSLKYLLRTPLIYCTVLCFVLGISSLSTRAQTSLAGVVVDANTHAVLAGVTIRFKQLASGTTSQENGTFFLPIPSLITPDTLVLSRIGYTRLAVASRDLSLAKPQRFLLKQRQVALLPVAVTAAKLVERKYGISSQKALMHFTDGTTRPGEAFEIAQVIKVDQPTVRVTSVNLFLATSLPDSVTVIIRFYSFNGQRPTQAIGPPPFQRRVAIQAGWLRVDLPPTATSLPQVFVVGLAFKPSSKPIPYEIKLGGGMKSFARTTTPDWRVPPHHYRLYVTALVPRNMAPSHAEDADNQETSPTTYLYSPTVQDSFALYVQLPKGYRPARKRTYPVVLLLDANAYFDGVSADLNRLPQATSALMIGIGYKDVRVMDSLRQRDYTYPAALPADSFTVSGGGQRFLTFLTQQVLPYVDQHYHTDPSNRTLMGHSLGGYFVLYALAEALRTQAPAFAHYVAASPSLYYGNEYLRRELAALPASTKSLPNQTLFITAGGRELERGDAESRAAKAAFNAFVQELSTSKFAAVTLKSIIYPNYSHLETAIITFADGWRGLRQPK
jgi:predicted alpha/beta superfamily hydrolase